MPILNPHGKKTVADLINQFTGQTGLPLEILTPSGRIADPELPLRKIRQKRYCPQIIQPLRPGYGNFLLPYSTRQTVIMFQSILSERHDLHARIPDAAPDEILRDIMPAANRHAQQQRPDTTRLAQLVNTIEQKIIELPDFAVFKKEVTLEIGVFLDQEDPLLDRYSYGQLFVLEIIPPAKKDNTVYLAEPQVRYCNHKTLYQELLQTIDDDYLLDPADIPRIGELTLEVVNRYYPD